MLSLGRREAPRRARPSLPRVSPWLGGLFAHTSSESLSPSRSHLLSQVICYRWPVTWEALASPLLCRSTRKFPSLRLLPVPLPSPTPATHPSPSPFPLIAPSVGIRFLCPSAPPPLFFSFSLPPLSPCYARPASSLSTHPAASSPLSLLSLPPLPTLLLSVVLLPSPLHSFSPSPLLALRLSFVPFPLRTLSFSGPPLFARPAFHFFSHSLPSSHHVGSSKCLSLSRCRLLL